MATGFDLAAGEFFRDSLEFKVQQRDFLKQSVGLLGLMVGAPSKSITVKPLPSEQADTACCNSEAR